MSGLVLDVGATTTNETQLLLSESFSGGSQGESIFLPLPASV